MSQVPTCWCWGKRNELKRRSQTGKEDNRGQGSIGSEVTRQEERVHRSGLRTLNYILKALGKYGKQSVILLHFRKKSE